MEQLALLGEKIRAAIARVRTELITQINMVFTAILLALSNAQAIPSEQVVELLPEGVLRTVVRTAWPILVGIIVQYSVELAKKRAVEAAVTPAVPE